MSAGTYIWQGLKPCLKMFLTIGCGFALTKSGKFPPAASKGLSQVTMNVGLPCLLFSSMVPSYNSSNISNFGPLCLVSLLFQLMGLIMILIIREVFYVPADFQWGMLILGSISNWGNLPTAIVQSVATEAPFDPTTDPSLGIAYIAVFILVMNLVFYGTGLYRILGWDLRDDLEEIPRTFSGRMARRKGQFRNLMKWYAQKRHGKRSILQPGSAQIPEGSQLEAEAGQGVGQGDGAGVQRTERIARMVQKYAPPSFPGISRIPSSHADIESLTLETMDTGGEPVIRPEPLSLAPSRAALKEASVDHEKIDEGNEGLAQAAEERQEREIHEHPQKSILKSILHSCSGLISPVSLGVIISLPFALVDPLKALVVTVSGWSGTKIANAPDGKSPLGFIFDFTVFVGAMTVPGGLIILGASFARLKINRSKMRDMPIGAILASTVAKMFLMPLIGIFVVIGFRDNTTLFPRDQKMLSFVAFLLSGTPSAVNQLVVTQIFAKEGQTMDTLSSFLLAQYVLLLIQSAALTAISLWLVS